MDCNYIQQNEIHEEYLLNRLPESEKYRYEKHIAECSSCKQELEKQKQLIASIRAIGKQEMKNEIKTQVEEVKAQQKSIDWQMILKVAAVVFVIALIPSAIYYFQTDSGESLSQLPKAEQLETEQDTYFTAKETGQKEESDQTTPPKKQTTPALEQAAAPEQPASGMAMGEAPSEYESDSAIKGRGIASGEMMALDDAEDSISEMVGLQAGSVKADSSQSEIDKEELEQVLANGVTYQFVQTKEEDTGRFDTEEINTLQKYDAPAAQKLTPNYRGKEKEGVSKGYPLMSTAIFKAEDKRITIYLHAAHQELILDEESNLPQSFDVLILNRDSLDLKMSWQVNKEFLDYDASQMKIVINDQTMYFTILENYIYDINLNSDSTTAILMEK